ncbi:MAG TPA: efflux RND transporter periplasmic adaptor subunit, partial [Candidatus Brocadiaceae bacterium]
LVGKESSEGKSAYNTTQKEMRPELLTLDKHAQEMAGIKTVEVKRAYISKIVEFPAELDFDRTKIISINCPIDGKVVKVNRNQGDMIKQGDTLAEIENPQTVGQIFKVNTQFNGFVTRRNINPMVWVTRGNTLFEVVDTSKLWGVIHLYTEESPEIKTGQKVRFVVSDSSQSLDGEINYISPSIDPDTRTIEARVVVDNPGNIPVHTYAVAQVTTDEKIHAIVIPEIAVFPEDFGKIVFTMDKNTFKKRTIETGIKRDGKVEVLQGLEEGDLLVTEGAYQLKNLTFKSKGGGEEGELEGR